MDSFTPEEDSRDIWGAAYISGSAGASWYADSLHDEALDSVAYLHHLRARLRLIRSLARLLREDDGMTTGMAATILEHLAGDHAPRPRKSAQPRHHD